RLATPVILLAFGSLCTLLGFLGCCGAIRENYCLTVSFAVLLALVIMIETAAVITAYALHEDLRSGLSTQLQIGLSRYNRSSGVQMAWDQTQQTLSCCGVANSSDWSALGAIPDSCCIEPVSNCAKELAPLHSGGCMDKVESKPLVVNCVRFHTINTYRNQHLFNPCSIPVPTSPPAAKVENDPFFGLGVFSLKLFLMLS
ncbi:Tetraspanin, partial [Trichostrongylus colubriformis]